MKEKNRAVAFILALAVLFVMFFSAFYITKNANHDCIGEDCPVCEQIAVCETTLYGISTVMQSGVAAVFIPALCILAAKTFYLFFFSDTLVSLKVKLSS
ncbi:MAG: hypothetical protein LUE24_03565 [Lachnospiraceae bacterium]|nr:hypothetical protein [Lachnospiraceae bacterium]